MPINTDINSRIHTIRNIFNKTQFQFSQELGFTQGIISKIENNKVPVTDDLISKIEEIYCISSLWMLTGEKPLLHINPKTEKDILKLLEVTYGLSSTDLRVLNNFLNLNNEQRKTLYNLFLL
jgi:transcriptional regulator with XRE-family HTH domain